MNKKKLIGILLMIPAIPTAIIAPALYLFTPINSNTPILLTMVSRISLVLMATLTSGALFAGGYIIYKLGEKNNAKSQTQGANALA